MHNSACLLNIISPLLSQENVEVTYKNITPRQIYTTGQFGQNSNCRKTISNRPVITSLGLPPHRPSSQSTWALSANLVVLLHILDNPISKYKVMLNTMPMFACTRYALLPNLPLPMHAAEIPAVFSLARPRA
jgi:hypothetical protein